MLGCCKVVTTAEAAHLLLQLLVHRLARVPHRFHLQADVVQGGVLLPHQLLLLLHRIAGAPRIMVRCSDPCYSSC